MPALYLPALVVTGAGAMSHALVASGEVQGALWTIVEAIDRAEPLYFAAYFTLAVAVLVDSYRRTRGLVPRRQVKWLLWGTAAGVFPFLAFYALPFALGRASTGPSVPDGGTDGSGAIGLDEKLGLTSNFTLDATLERARAVRPPLEIINGPLMKGMDEVGRLFNANELIVPEVLQSAEAMKAAVSHLERYMEKSETSARGRMLLATVKGDVHDIGKNLVEIIFGNNGYEIVNLGIKVPPQALIDAYGVEAQMLGPLVRRGTLIGWISVHHAGGPRTWRDADVAALDEATHAASRLLERV